MLTYDLIVFVILAMVMLVIASSIVFSTIKIGIPPMPSSNKAYQAMIQFADETGSGPIIDLGSGWGNFVIRIAKRYPHRQIIGYELSYLPWLITCILKKLLRLKNLTLHRQNFYQADLSSASVLVCYLFPKAMEKISHKLQSEQSNINFLISNNFALPTWKPSKTIQLNDFYRSPVYLYNIANTRL